MKTRLAIKICITYKPSFLISGCAIVGSLYVCSGQSLGYQAFQMRTGSRTDLFQVPDFKFRNPDGPSSFSVLEFRIADRPLSL